jgi:fused signal recognition particle receptor
MVLNIISILIFFAVAITLFLVFKKRRKGISSIVYSGTKRAMREILKEVRGEEDLLEAIERALIAADTGVEEIRKIIDRALKIKKEKNISLLNSIKESMKEALKICEGREKFLKKNGIKYILVIGVNGVGKTLFCVKMAKYAKKLGFNPCLVAGDRFRAGAISQLKIMGEKFKIPVFSPPDNIPADGVLYDSYSYAKKHGFDLLIVDTAGRNHVNESLIRELKKLCRVIEKVKGTPPEEIFVVIDANTGQNSISQVLAFSEVGKITGIVLSKADSSAKGGVIFGICERGFPVRFVSAGEDENSLYPFNPDDFINAITEGIK